MKYSPAQVAARAAEFTGKKIGTSWVYTQIHALRGNDRLSKSDYVSQEEMQALCEYAARHYNRSNVPTIAEFCRSRDGKLPQPFMAAAVVKKKKVPAQNDAKSTDAAIMRELKILRKEIDALKTTTNSKPTGLLASSQKKRDVDLEPLHKAVNNFVFNEPITVSEVWKRLQREFEKRNSITVYRVGTQSFPQWLRHEDHLELFMGQLQGFFDQIHNDITHSQNGQKALNL
jgi:hypothetical protein